MAYKAAGIDNEKPDVKGKGQCANNLAYFPFFVGISIVQFGVL
jgi:hypothetical protein